ncbi:hypothetical protein FDECE_4465 [Fusarium decemcellulare]|nr:hypothetical protein FDECE_4465 [Fusarium decemcellulare]
MSDQATSPRPRLRIAIIGAGIAGLAAALVLRKRHDVTIYERNLPSTPEAAGGLGLGPNGTKMCKELGLAKEDIGGVSLKGFKTWNKEGKLIKEVEVEFEEAFGSEWWCVHRQDLKDVLHQKVMARGEGREVKILYGEKVIGTNVVEGTTELEMGPGEVFDVIVGADGIHSKTRRSVIGPGHPPPVPSGLSAYRFTMPFDVVQRVLADIPNPLHYGGGVYANMIVADDGTGRSMMIYPCRDLKVVYFAAGVPDSALQEETAYSWRLDGDPRGMMKYFHDFPPWIRSIMKATPAVSLLQLRDQDPLPTYVNARTVLIGDAAHPMVPHQGQGANQALEDAEALRLLLDETVTRESVPRVLERWEAVRRLRASKVQLNSRIVGQDMSQSSFMEKMVENWSWDGVKARIEDIREGKLVRRLPKYK